MSNTLKIIMGGVALIVVIVAIAGYMLFSNLDSLVKVAIEAHGSDATKTRVQVNQVEIKLTEGSAAIGGLSVGNPAGYETAQAFKLGRASISLDTSQTGPDLIYIKEIAIDAPDVTYEFGGEAKSNLQAIQKNVEAYTGGGQAAQKDTSKKGEGPKLIIDDLWVRDGTVNVSANFLKGESLKTPLPTIHLTDIGKGDGDKGATPGEVAEALITAIQQSASGAVGQLDIKGLMESAGQMGEDAKKKLDDATKGATDSLGKAGEDIGGAVKGLLGK